MCHGLVPVVAEHGNTYQIQFYLLSINLFCEDSEGDVITKKELKETTTTKIYKKGTHVN